MSRTLKIAAFTVPLIVGLGLLMGRISNSGYGNPWFDGLAKPSAMPPGWVFGVAWTILYALVGISVAIVLATEAKGVRRAALSLFGAQLLLNYSWSPIFFRWQQVELALAVLVVMLVTAVAAALSIGRLSRTAAWLLAPYLGWLCFASYLNFEILRLNPAG